MDTWTEEQQSEFQQLTDMLAERGANRPCPMCGFEAGMGIEGFGLQPVYADADGEESLGAIATLVVTCENCGFLAQFALPNEETDEDEG